MVLGVSGKGDQTTSEAIQKEITELLQEQWDVKNKRWKTDAESYQQKYRDLKNRIKWLEQETIVDNIRKGKAPAEQRDKIFPLVSRRRHLGDKHRDGQLWTFSPQQNVKFIKEFCGCGKYPATPEATAEWAKTATKQDEDLAVMHLAECPNKLSTEVEEPIKQIKHVVGDWECRGCLLSEDGQKRQIDWCPRFFRMLRHLHAGEYEKTVKASSESNMTCYAGLMHTQIEFNTEYDEESREEYQTVTIIRKCDTCGFETRETKTSARHVEAPVKAGEAIDLEELETKRKEQLVAAIRNELERIKKIKDITAAELGNWTLSAETAIAGNSTEVMVTLFNNMRRRTEAEQEN